jgi:hypothetical protein
VEGIFAGCSAGYLMVMWIWAGEVVEPLQAGMLGSGVSDVPTVVNMVYVAQWHCWK